MLRPRANEIPRLIRQLGSRRRAQVDAARARLSIIGSPAVETLIESLDSDDERLATRAIRLLALIADPRGREPLIAMLLDDRPVVREAAADGLARFPSEDVIRALNRHCAREKRTNVRAAAVRSLVEVHVAGHSRALRLPLELLLDATEPVPIRLAASSLVRTLPAAERGALLARLEEDPEPAIRKRAREIAGDLERATHPSADRIARLLQDLSSEDYGVWNRAVRQLGRCGPAGVDPLIEAMCARSHDPEFCTRAGMALKFLGPRQGRPLGDALDRIDEPLPLQVLVEVIGALGNKSLIYRLKDLLDRLASSREEQRTDGFDRFGRVRAKAHLELARVGSRVAIQDLREALADSSRGLGLELLSAAEAIGKRDELGLLVAAHGREDEFVRSRIADAIRTIVRRERIRRDDRTLARLSADEKTTLDRILRPRGRRPRKRRPEPPPP